MRAILKRAVHERGQHVRLSPIFKLQPSKFPSLSFSLPLYGTPEPWEDPKHRSTFGFDNLHNRVLGFCFLDPPRALGFCDQRT